MSACTSKHPVVGPPPAQRHPDQGRAVALTPADRCRRLLMGNQPQETGGHGVAEGGQRRSSFQQPGDGAARRIAQPLLTGEQVHCVADQTPVHVHPRAGLTTMILGAKVTNRPRRCATSRRTHFATTSWSAASSTGDRQELDLLLHHLPVTVKMLPTSA